MQQRLSLPRPAHWVAGRTMPLYLRNVPPDGFPALDLPGILVRHASAHIIPAIPLEPAARIRGVYPTFLPPDRERLARIDAEIVARAVAARRGKPSARKPAGGEFLAAVRHVLTAENSKREHLFGRELRTKFRIEMAADRRTPDIAVFPLHLVVHGNDSAPFFAHDGSLTGFAAAAESTMTWLWLTFPVIALKHHRRRSVRDADQHAAEEATSVRE